MATISHNDRAPSGEAVTYSLGSAEPFTLEGAGATFEVPPIAEDASEVERAEYDAFIGNAREHPWLTVEVPAEASLEGGDQAAEVAFPKTAIDAGLDQDEVHYEGEKSETPIAETLAADQEQGDEPVEVDSETPEKPVQPQD